MKISILCSNAAHPVVPWLHQWQRDMANNGHQVSLYFTSQELVGGHMLFLVSCSEIISDLERRKFTAVLVLHASDLPQGRGWSPHIWSIIGGSNEITLCLLEATDPVDTGPIWLKTRLQLEGHELLPEINEKLFSLELGLMTEAVRSFGKIRPVPQEGKPGSYLRRRIPEDSRIDVHKSIAEQFDLLRVVDNERFPAFFDHRGKRFLLRIEKVNNAN